MSMDKFPFDKYALELCVISFLSLAAFFITRSLLKSFGQVFIRAGLHGVDMSKPNKPTLYARSFTCFMCLDQKLKVLLRQPCTLAACSFSFRYHFVSIFSSLCVGITPKAVYSLFINHFCLTPTLSRSKLFCLKLE